MTTRKDQSSPGQTSRRVDGTAEDEVFIVRIYRRDVQDQQLLVGTIENIARNCRGSFRTRDELCELLSKGGEQGEP